jgi:tetratricopeptide (TPR) repeat protein
VQAETAVVALDDAQRASADELDWAREQLGGSTVATFNPALAGARAALAAAMVALEESRQADPDSPAQVASLQAVLHHAGVGCEQLDAAAPELDALRDLRHAVAALQPVLVAQLALARERAARADARLDALQDRWRPSSVAGPRLHLHRAGQGLTFAEACLGVVSGAHGSAGAGHGAGLVRLAEASLSQANRLLDQVERAPDLMALAERAAMALLAQAQADRAEGQRLGLDQDRRWHFADDTVEWAQGTFEDPTVDPVSRRRALEESEAALHGTLRPVRSSAEALHRAEALLPTATETAEAMLAAAEVLVRTRCGAVGVEARLRLAQAHLLLETGARCEDPDEALALLRRADHLAEQAATLAQQDEAALRDGRRRSVADWDASRETAILIGALLPLAPGGWAAVRFGGPATRTRLPCVLPGDLAAR